MELERHVVRVGMTAAGRTTRRRGSASAPDDADDETPPVDPQFATEPVAPAARLDAPSERSAE